MKPSSKRSLAEKAIRIRQAAMMTWLLGWVATATAVFTGLSNSFKLEWFYSAPVALVVSFFLQRGFTAMESGMTSGELDVPWKHGWALPAVLPWVLALCVLFVDVLLTLSAAYIVLNNADVGGQALGMSDGQENNVRSFVLVIISIAICLGSEILRSWADMIDPTMEDEEDIQASNERAYRQHQQQSNARPAQGQQSKKGKPKLNEQQIAQHRQEAAERAAQKEEADGDKEEDTGQGRDRRAIFRSRQQRRQAAKN